MELTNEEKRMIRDALNERIADALEGGPGVKRAAKAHAMAVLRDRVQAALDEPVSESDATSKARD
jgi:hypothetical protein